MSGTLLVTPAAPPTVTERLDIAHDLPDALRDALRDESRTAGTLYNALQDLDEAASADRFDAALAAFRSVLSDADVDFVIAVVGLEVGTTADDLVADADLLSVHEPSDDGSVRRLLYAGDENAARDTVVMLPVRPGDCPPGSGQRAGALSTAEFREVVAAMTFKRFDLLQNDLDAYRDSYLRPAVRGLEAYAQENDL